jgi:hypothetical protein
VQPGVPINCNTLSLVLPDVRLLCYWLEGLKETIDPHVNSGRAPAQHVRFCAGPPVPVVQVAGPCRWADVGCPSLGAQQTQNNDYALTNCSLAVSVSSKMKWPAQEHRSAWQT